jgi:hypothetical protein
MLEEDHVSACRASGVALDSAPGKPWLLPADQIRPHLT